VYRFVKNNTQTRIDALGRICTTTRSPICSFNVPVDPVEYELWEFYSSEYAYVGVPVGSKGNDTSIPVYHSCKCSCRTKDVKVSGHITCSGEKVSTHCEFSGCSGKVSIDYSKDVWTKELQREEDFTVPEQLIGPTDISWWARPTEPGDEVICRYRCMKHCEGKNGLGLPPDIFIPDSFSCEDHKGDYGY